VTAVAVPLHVATAVLFGLTLGSALLLAFGAPRRRVELGALASDLADAGIAAQDIAPIGDTGVIGATVEDLPVRLHIIDRDDRDADLLYRIFTNAQRRGIENERFAWSPERIADQEALVTLLAARAGVPVLEVVGLARTADGAGVVVVAHDDVQAINTFDPDEITDALLQDAWRAVTSLHDQRIAHGRLHAGHLYRGNTDRGQPHVVIGDLSRAQLGASGSRISIDVAEFLTSTALLVGPARAVAAARVVPVERLAAALPLLQPLALSPPTRRGIGHGSTDDVDVLDELRSAVQVAASVDEYQMAELQRISFGRVVSVLGTGVLVFVFLAFASNWSSIADAMREADWVYLPAILAMAALTYPAGALSLMGGVTARLPFSQTSGVMLAQSFLNRFTPANIGGMALRTRYLQKNGVDLPVAASSVGLTSMASGLVQLVFIIGFLLWSGSDNDARFSLPDASTIAIGMLALLVVGAAIWATPLRHRLLDSKLTVSALQIWRNVVDLARSPGKVALLFGGAALGKMAIILAFAWSARALGIELPFAEIGALYLTANTVASVAPTPGGVGAMEAALIAVLTGAGVDGAAALSAVLVFRVATFWLPVPFAWATLRHLRKRQVV
jgi:undecaprenyl-diphosphatase